MKTSNLFDLSHTLAGDLLLSFEYPWLALPSIKDFLCALTEKLRSDNGYYLYSESVLVSKNARISPTATVCGPCIIGENTEIRTGAFIRGSVMIGDDCVVGISIISETRFSATALTRELG